MRILGFQPEGSFRAHARKQHDKSLSHLKKKVLDRETMELETKQEYLDHTEGKGLRGGNTAKTESVFATD